MATPKPTPIVAAAPLDDALAEAEVALLDPAAALAEEADVAGAFELAAEEDAAELEPVVEAELPEEEPVALATPPVVGFMVLAPEAHVAL